MSKRETIKEKNKVSLTQLEKRLLHNFVLGDRNRILYPKVNNLEESNSFVSVLVQVKASWVNCNNFDDDEEYKKALDKLEKKLR